MPHALYEEFGKSRVPLIVEQLHNLSTEFTSQGIKHWLDWGNLLGACRGSGFITHDKDFDISFFRSDFDAVQTICEANTNFKTIVHNFEIDSMIRLFWMETPEQVFSNEYLYTDLYPHIIDNGLVVMDTNKGRATEGGFVHEKFAESYLTTPTNISFEGYSFPCPNPLINFISSTHRFGTGWNTLDLGERATRSQMLSVSA